MKYLSDTPNTNTFTAELPDYDKSKEVGTAIMGYMLGTFEQSVIEITYTSTSILVEYAGDEDLTEIFEQITNGFL